MKKLISLLLAAVLLFTLASASAETFDRTIDSLKTIVNKYAGSHEVDYYTGSSGTEYIIVDFAPDGYREYSICLWINLAGTDDRIVEADLYFSDNEWKIDEAETEAALNYCNMNNCNNRYPTMYFNQDDHTIGADNYLYTVSDTPIEMVEEFIDNMIWVCEKRISELPDSGLTVFSSLK